MELLNADVSRTIFLKNDNPPYTSSNLQIQPGGSNATLIGRVKMNLSKVDQPFRERREFGDELPLSPVGKILKRTIREKFWQGQSRTFG